METANAGSGLETGDSEGRKRIFKAPTLLRPINSKSMAEKPLTNSVDESIYRRARPKVGLSTEEALSSPQTKTMPLSRSMLAQLKVQRGPRVVKKGDTPSEQYGLPDWASLKRVSEDRSRPGHNVLGGETPPRRGRRGQAVTQDHKHPGNLAVLGAKEIEQIKELALGHPQAAREREMMARKVAAERERDEKHRAHMAALWAEKQALLEELSEFEQEKEQERQKALDRLRDSRLQEMDEVKRMNQLVSYAQAARVREGQVLERKMLKELETEEKLRMNSVVEIERLKGVQKDMEREEKRKKGMLKGAEVIVKQIEEREQEQKAKIEALRKEGQAVVEQIKQAQEQEKVKVQERKHNQAKQLEAMYASNAEQIKVKEAKAQEEAEANEKIAKYQIEKQIKEAEAREQALKKKQEKEHEINRLREIQEKVQDSNKELDEIRARRAMEKADRLAREKDAKEARKKLEINDLLLEARKHQTLSKQQLLEQQALAEREEFQRLVELSQQKRELEVEAERVKQQKVGGV